MASNNIELITKYSPKAWDTVYKQESMSSLLDTDSKLVQFTGAKTVKIAKWQNGGLHNYYRNNAGDDRVPAIPGSGTDFIGAPGFGYQKSGARLVWEEFTLRVDRAAAFLIEKFDNEESGEELVGLGVTEISRTTIIPEVDAYCFSTLASYCDTQLGNYVSENIGSTPLAELNAALLYFDNHEVPIQDQIIFVAPKFLNALRTSTEANMTRFLGQTDFSNKDIKFTITEYEGRKLVSVSPERLRTNIVLGAEGYSWGAGSKPINFLAVSKSAVAHVVKYEKVKVIGDDLNLAGNGFDGYTIYARIYHDVFVPDNKKIGLYVSVADTETTNMTVADAISVKYAGGYSASAVISDITYFPGNKLVSYGYQIGGSAVTAGSDVPGTIYGMKLGTTVDMSQSAADAAADKTVYFYAYAGGKVTAVQTVTVPKLSA